MEKVWIAEQKAEQEEKKVKEFQKQLQKERELQELRQLQNANGVVSRTVDNSLEWMYQGPASELNKQESAEEFLLGKIYKGSNDKGKSETSTGKIGT